VASELSGRRRALMARTRRYWRCSRRRDGGPPCAVVEKATAKAVFEAYVEQVLAPLLFDRANWLSRTTWGAQERAGEGDCGGTAL
jgi:hypothetical protein